jgi:HEXXH motif-containing protein
MNALPQAFLTLPPDDHSVRALRGAVAKLALRTALSWPLAGLPRGLQVGLSTARAALVELTRSRAALVLGAVAHPDVLSPLLALRSGASVRSPAELLAASFLPLLAALDGPESAGAWAGLRWSTGEVELVDPRRHRVLRGTGPLGLRGTADGLEVVTTSGAFPLSTPDQDLPPDVLVERPFHPLLGGLHLSLRDGNPLSTLEAHPDKDGNAVSLGGQPVEVWLDRYRTALEVIRVALPTWHAELGQSLQRLVPVGYLPERHLSASYREAPGTAYLSLCDDPMTLAEALVHETQHSKLNLLSWSDPVVHNGHSCWTASPVRPDLRPLWGVLLAAHAFVPVGAMYDRLAELDHPISRTERFPRRRAEVLSANTMAMDTLRSLADCTPTGRRLFDDLDTLHTRLLRRAPDLGLAATFSTFERTV